MVVQITFSLPEVISAEPEVLGRVDSIAISGLTGTVSTPSDNHLQAAREYWEMVEWEWADPADLESPVDLAFNLPAGEHVDWGWISTKREYGVGISTLVLSLDSDRTRLEVDIHAWFGTLSDWLQAYTLQVLTPQSIEKGLPSRSIRAWRLGNGGAEEAIHTHPRIRPHAPGWILVTPPIWAASVRRASTGEELPLSWQLLTDGLRALHAGHPRRAVVEAFTALEVTVRQAIRGRVELCGDPAVASLIVKRRNTLGPLLEMARDLGIVLPAALTRSIVEVRNSVVHSGSLPTQRDALTIWQAAHTFTQQQSPLPPP